MAQRMLGKKPPKKNLKTLSLAKYLDATALPVAVEKVYREYDVPPGGWQVLMNNELGCCTISAISHMLAMFSEHTGTLVMPTDDEVVAAYSAVSGYVPGSPATDNGAAITDVLEYWQTIGIAGHKILGWAAIDQTNIAAVKQAIQFFGAVDVGVNLPNSALEQNELGQPWSIVSPDGGIAGGHSVCHFGFGSEGTNCITWGARQGMEWDWFEKYCDEAFVVITEDWINQATQQTPGGLDLATLQADLAALKA